MTSNRAQPCEEALEIVQNTLAQLNSRSRESRALCPACCIHLSSLGIKTPQEQHYHRASKAPRTTPARPVDGTNPETAAPVNVEGATAELAGGETVATAGTEALAGAGGAPPKAGGGGLGVAAAGATAELDHAGHAGGADEDVVFVELTATRGIFAALAMYASMVLGEELFWLMTMAIPFSQ